MPLLYRILRVSIFSILIIVIPTLLLFSAAPHWLAARRAAEAFTGVLRRAHNVYLYAPNRSAACSWGELWRLSATSDRSTPAGIDVLRQEGNLQLVHTPIGQFWTPIRDFPAVVETVREMDREIYFHPRLKSMSSFVVLDVGANVGMFTRRALQAGASLVVAIEPNPEVIECLRLNFASEIQQRRVIIYPKGLWDRDEELMLSTSSVQASTANSVALPRGARGPTVSLTTMDKMVLELGLSEVNFIKLDIEGAEEKALQGGRQTLARFRPLLAVALEHRASDQMEIPNLLHSILPAYKLEMSPVCTIADNNLVPQVAFASP